MISKQVLAHQAEGGPFSKPPAQLRIQPGVGRHRLRRKALDKISSCIPGKTARDVYVGPHLCLVPRARSLGVRRGSCVLSCGISMQMHEQERVARAQPPTIHYFPIQSDFRAFGRTVQLVIENEWKDQMHGERVDRQEW